MNVLSIRAGRRALTIIREKGLDAAMVEVVPGAAGGPKAAASRASTALVQPL